MLLKVIVLCCALVASQADGLTQDVIDVFIYEHNRVRADVCVGPLIWNQTLSDYAASRVTQCDYFISPGNYAENKYVTTYNTDNVALAAASLKAWEYQKQYVSPPNWSCAWEGTYRCEQYSQIVWKKNKSVGCAIIHCDVQITHGIGDFVLCEYDPSADYAGAFPY